MTEVNDQHIDPNTQAPTQVRSDSNTDVRKFLSLAQQRFKLSAEVSSENRTAALDDLKFSIGEQWPPEIVTQRTIDKRPVLTINRLPGIIRQVTNEQRQQRPSILVNPIGDGATVDTAKIEQGIVRHIEVRSDAEIAYDTACDQSVRTGWGYLRVLTEDDDDEDENSFNLEIRISRIKNQFSVYPDVYSQQPDYSDSNWCFIISDMDPETYRAEYPDSELASLSDYTSVGDRLSNWVTKDAIRVAEYFYVVTIHKIKHQLDDGSIIDDEQEEYEEDGETKTRTKVPEGRTIVQSRTKKKRQVKWAKINAVEILEQKDWPGKWIPIVPVLADDIDVDGKRHVAGLVRHCKDPQRMYNYWNSAATEAIALAPKAPFIVAEGQLEGHEAEWRQANVKNMPFLSYKPVALSGQPVPPPQRNTAEPPIQAMGMMIKQADNDIKGTTGIYDASLGQRGPDESGRAILARQKQGDIATYNFTDNLSRAMRQVGRILLDLIPKIYDVPKIQRIINPDNTVDRIGIYNSKNLDAGMTQEAIAQQLGIKKIFDLGVGKYDVAISIGPSYQSKRQEAVASMMALVNAYPMMMQAAGDLLVRNMDWPGAEEIANRLKMLLPPQLQVSDSDDPKTQVLQLQSQLKMFMDQHSALVKELNDATEIIKTKKMDVESKERIAAMNNQVQLVITQAKIQGEGALAKLSAEFDAINKRLDFLHENMSIDQEDLGLSGAASTPAPTPGGPTPQATPGAAALPPTNPNPNPNMLGSIPGAPQAVPQGPLPAPGTLTR